MAEPKAKTPDSPTAAPLNTPSEDDKKHKKHKREASDVIVKKKGNSSPTLGLSQSNQDLPRERLGDSGDSHKKKKKKRKSEAGNGSDSENGDSIAVNKSDSKRVYSVSDGESSKIHRLLGEEVDPIRDAAARAFAPQPPHVKRYKMKKKFGEDVVVDYNIQQTPQSLHKLEESSQEGSSEDGHTGGMVGALGALAAGQRLRKSLRSGDEADARQKAAQSRRVQKFFGEKFDLDQVAYEQRIRPDSLSDDQSTNKEVQPAHVDVAKLNRFFGTKPEIHKRTDSEEDRISRRRFGSPITRRLSDPYDSDGSKADTEEGEPEKHKADDSGSDSEERSSERTPSKTRVRSMSVGAKPSTPIKLGRVNSGSETSSTASESEDVYENEEALDEEIQVRRKALGETKTNKKLRQLLGSTVVPAQDKNARQFAPQPAHVKQYKLNKHFGAPVALTQGSSDDEPDSEFKEEHKGNKLLFKFFGSKQAVAHSTPATPKNSSPRKKEKDTEAGSASAPHSPDGDKKKKHK